MFGSFLKKELVAIFTTLSLSQYMDVGEKKWMVKLVNKGKIKHKLIKNINIMKFQTKESMNGRGSEKYFPSILE